jgi:hypothetical protein
MTDWTAGTAQTKAPPASALRWSIWRRLMLALVLLVVLAVGASAASQITGCCASGFPTGDPLQARLTFELPAGPTLAGAGLRRNPLFLKTESAETPPATFVVPRPQIVAGTQKLPA